MLSSGTMFAKCYLILDISNAFINNLVLFPHPTSLLINKIKVWPQEMVQLSAGLVTIRPHFQCPDATKTKPNQTITTTRRILGLCVQRDQPNQRAAVLGEIRPERTSWMAPGELLQG